jgi:methionyl aminopeptidase
MIGAMRQVFSQSKLDQAAAAAEKVVVIHQRLAEWLRAGLTLAQVDAFVAEQLEDLGAKSCFKGYRVPRTPAFPSFACLSVNDCIVHGTAGMSTKPLEEGDFFSIDVGVTYRGWIGDAAWTYAIGHLTDDAAKLAAAGRESIARGVEAIRPGGIWLDFAEAVQKVVEHDHGLHLVRGLGGHGYGRKLHAPPFISNVVPRYRGEWPDAHREIAPGDLVAVEPMLAIGTNRISQTPGGWPIFTSDGSLSAHYEHDVLVGEDGPIVLTKDLEKLPDVVG